MDEFNTENINKLGKYVAPGIWEDANGNPHFSIPDLLNEFGIPYTEENVDRLKRDLIEMFKTKHPDCKPIWRKSPDDKGTPLT